MPVSAAIHGCAGLELSAAERAFFRAVKPWGFILFRRNIETPDQVRRLIDALRGCVGRADAPVLIDQEGGRVARLGPPHWPARAAVARLATAFDHDPASACLAVWLHFRLIAADCAALGINVVCAPVLDLAMPGGHDIIGDRAFGADPFQVATLGRAACAGLLAGGVLPVLKHVPGHGRAAADSHVSLPRVAADRASLSASDFLPFRALADMPLAMSAHVLYAAIDPERPATLSPRLIAEVVRGEIGFAGALLSDDLDMGALTGAHDLRARAALEAGCDVVLQCNGRLADMEATAAGVSALAGPAAARCAAALSRRATPEPFDLAEGKRQLDSLLAGALA
jgi:beta-N-acetylhexosaminidase